MTHKTRLHVKTADNSNSSHWKDNNVTYERRVVADLGHGKKEREKIHAQIKFSRYTRVSYIPSPPSTCLFPALLCLEMTSTL